jgi:cytochrome b subunit of formate dehydrogenase
VLLILITTGLPLYYPLVVEPFLSLLGLSIHGEFLIWIEPHVLAAVILLVLVISHIIWDSGKLRATKLVMPNLLDFREAIARAKNFVWFSGKDYPRSGKYDVFMKSYHILLVVCFAMLGVTGLVQYFYAPWWLYPELQHAQIEPWWKPTQLHDFFGFLLIALVVAHTYFSLLPVNRALFRSMISGKIAMSEYDRKIQMQS